MSNANSSANKKHSAESIQIGGITPFTTIDYPGQLAAVLYLQGCPWRCHYCHNSELLNRQRPARHTWSAVVEFLQRRKTLIDAVVFSGGEPTLQQGLGHAMQAVKDLGFRVGLHSAGIYPRRLQQLLPLVDWIGLDIKASPEAYAELTGVGNSARVAWQSLQLVLASGVDYEVRSTLHPQLLNRDKLFRLVDELRGLQVENYAIQSCVTQHSQNPDYRLPQSFPLGPADVAAIAARFTRFELRGTD